MGSAEPLSPALCVESERESSILISPFPQVRKKRSPEADQVKRLIWKGESLEMYPSSRPARMSYRVLGMREEEWSVSRRA